MVFWVYRWLLIVIVGQLPECYSHTWRYDFMAALILKFNYLVLILSVKG